MNLKHVKVQVGPGTAHEDPEEKYRCRATLSSTLAIDWSGYESDIH